MGNNLIVGTIIWNASPRDYLIRRTLRALCRKYDAHDLPDEHGAGDECLQRVFAFKYRVRWWFGYDTSTVESLFYDALVHLAMEDVDAEVDYEFAPAR
jgi:hypothetical protein